MVSTAGTAAESASSGVRLVLNGFVKHRGIHHASALSFDTILGIVPLLVLVVSSLKALGAYEGMVSRIKPWLYAPADDTSTLKAAFARLLDLVEHADLSQVGALGFVAFLYIVWALLDSVEHALNQIFGARQSRSILRRLINYAALLMIAPMAIAITYTLGNQLVRGHDVVAGIRHLVVILVIGGSLTLVYGMVPNTRRHAAAVAIGGISAGAGLYAITLLMVEAQLGVARYNALYSGFAAIPLFLIWVFVAWVVVLFGAEIAAAVGHVHNYRFRVGGRLPSLAVREHLALRMFTEIGRAFTQGREALSAGALATAIDAPDIVCEGILEELADANLLARLPYADTRYLPARDISAIAVADVLDALRQTDGDVPPAAQSDTKIAALISGMQSAWRQAGGELTVRDLIDETR